MAPRPRAAQAARMEWVQGLRAMMAMLRALPRSVQQEITRELGGAVSPIVARARELAPRSEEQKRGRERRHPQDEIRVILRARGVLVGETSLDYGAVVHFGRQATQNSRGGNPYTRALTPTPWLYPAAEEQGPAVAQRLQPAIERALDIALASA